MARFFHRFVFALLIVHLQSGVAARRLMERASFEPSSSPGRVVVPEQRPPMQPAARVFPRAAPVTRSPEAAGSQGSAQDAGPPAPLEEQPSLRVRAWSSLLAILARGMMVHLNPGEAISFMFAVVCMVYSFSVLLRYGHDEHISLRLRAVDNQKQQFQHAYDAFTGSTVSVLHTLSESVALIAERSFEGRRRHFLELARRIREQPERLGPPSSECASALGQLASQWLAVFSECGMRRALAAESSLEEDALSGEELLEASASVERVAELACERLEKAELPADIARELRGFMGPQATQEELQALEELSPKGDTFPLTISCGERRLFLLISPSHAAVLLAFLLGLALAAYEASARQQWLAVAVLCADACVLGVLLRYEKIDRICRTEREVRRLRDQSRAARRRHERVAAFHQEVQAVTGLWLHRTMPQLEIFGELFDLLWGPSAASTDAALYPPLAEKLAQMRGGLGPLCKWRGAEAMRADQLQEIAGTLCTCADFIKAQQADAKPECLPDIILHLDQMELPISHSGAQPAAAAS